MIHDKQSVSFTLFAKYHYKDLVKTDKFEHLFLCGREPCHILLFFKELSDCDETFVAHDETLWNENFLSRFIMLQD